VLGGGLLEEESETLEEDKEEAFCSAGTLWDMDFLRVIKCFGYPP
jgi:hypothetical protein